MDTTEKTLQKEESQNVNRRTNGESIHTRKAEITLNLTNGVFYTILCTFLTLLISFLVTNHIKPSWINDLDKKIDCLVNEDNNTLLLLGSGTVYEYLKEEKDSFLLKNTISMPIPTIPALRALREEKRTQKNRLGWIIMSAMEANDTLIMGKKEIDDFYNNIGRIIQLHLKNDPLKIIVHPKSLFSAKKDNNITVEELAWFLSKKDSMNYKLFRTSVGSSTRTMFEKLLGYEISEKESDFFDMNTTKSTYQDGKNNNQFIVLGSDIYSPKDKALLENCKSYNVIDSDGMKIEKQLYLYFTAYWNNIHEKETELKLLPQTEKFIKGIVPNFKFDSRDANKKLILEATTK